MCLQADKKTRVPDWIGKLTSLVELEMYPTVEDMFFVKELRDLKLLHTRINVQDEGQARDLLESLSNMRKIEIINVALLGTTLDLTDAFMQPSLVLSNTLQKLYLMVFQFPRLPIVINPEALPYLYSLSLTLDEFNQQDMEIIGKFEKLSFLDIRCIGSCFSSNIIIRGSDGFQNLKSFCITVRPLKFLQGAMPSLEVIKLHIYVLLRKDEHLGLRNLSSLQRFITFLHCNESFPTAVEEVEAELRHIVDTHPNRPTLEIIRRGEDEMVSSQEWMIKNRLSRQFLHYAAMESEALEMDKLEENCQDVRDANNKVQRFHEQFDFTVARVNHELLLVKEHIHNCDLDAVTKDIPAMERAPVILSVEYPLIATMLEELRSAFGLQESMPRPEEINVNICVRDVKADNPGLDFGFRNLCSLQGIKAHLDCYMCFAEEAEEVEAVLRHTVDNHPNSPTLEIIRYWEDEMVNDSDSIRLLDRQKTRAERLQRRINHQMELLHDMRREAVEMGKLKTDSNPSDDAKHKAQRFLEQFSTTAGRMHDELLKLREDIPIRDNDLNSVAEVIAAKERALQILTIEYPRFIAMLDELRYVFGLQGAMTRLEVINLNICARDGKVNNVRRDNGLGNMSSLQEIKAHIDCYMCFPTEAQEVEAVLRHTVDIHPNRPTLKIIRYWEDEMVNESDSVRLLERQKLRWRVLWGRVSAQKKLHMEMYREAIEAAKLKIDLDLSEATLHLCHHVQRYCEQFNVTFGRVHSELLPVKGDICNCDLDRVTKDIAAMERALLILTMEYPRFTVMLNNLRTAFSLQGAMPAHEVIDMNICVRDVKADNLGLNFGLGNLSLLQRIKAHIDCYMCFPTEAEEVEALLRNAVDIHPNRPTLEIIKYWEDEMVDDSDSVRLLERQKLRGTILWGRIRNQMNLYNAMERELKSNLNLRDTKQKVQQFLEQCKATAGHVDHVLLPVQENIQNRDLNRVTKDCAAMERALQILTVENQRFAAMLEELRTAFSLQTEDDGTANIPNNVTEENAA